MNVRHLDVQGLDVLDLAAGAGAAFMPPSLLGMVNLLTKQTGAHGNDSTAHGYLDHARGVGDERVGILDGVGCGRHDAVLQGVEFKRRHANLADSGKVMFMPPYLVGVSNH